MTCNETLKGIFNSSSWKKRNKAAKEPSKVEPSSALRQEPQNDSQPANTLQSPPDKVDIPCLAQAKSNNVDHETKNDELKELAEMTEMKEIKDIRAELPRKDEQEELSDRLHDKTLRNGLWEGAYRKVGQELDGNVLAQFVKLLVEAEISQDEPGPSTDNVDERAIGSDLEKLQDIVKRKLDVIQEARLVIRGRVVRDEVSEIFGMVKTFKDIITATVSAEPHAALAWGCLAGFFPLLDNALAQFESAKTGLRVISDILSTGNQRLLSQVKDKIIDLYSQILKYQISLAFQYSRPSIKRLLRDIVLKDNWKAMYEDMQKTEESITLDLERLDQKTIASIAYQMSSLQKTVKVILNESIKVHQEINLLTQDALIRGLPEAQYAAFDTYRKSMPPPAYCHEDTRKKILREIQKWAKSSDGNCIFWLRGMAGTGKSTIARTAAKKFNDQLLLGASFFFSRSNADRADPDKLFPTLARQLADVLPGFAAHLKDSIQRKHDVTQQSLDQQWRSLLLEPLSVLSDSFPHPMVLVLVIDALDECQNGRIYAQSIIKVLATARTLKKIRLRIFVTSRPEDNLADGFTQIPSTTYYDVMIDHDGDRTTKRDIRIFLEDKLSDIATRKQANEAWPGKEKTEKLIEECGRLFIAAATACRLLEDTGFLNDTLDLLLNTKQHGSLTRDIDEMYTLVLEQAITKRGSDSIHLIPLFQLVVGSVITMPEALPLRKLAMLLREPCDKIRMMLKNLTSVLVVPEDDDSQVSLFHLSFRDYLVDPNRCKDRDILIDEKEANEKLFHRCMDILHVKGNLRRNICNIQHPGTAAIEVSQETINEHLPLEVQYACWYWGTHINSGGPLQPEQAAQLLVFLKEHFTHWLEALSLTRLMRLASPTMTELKTRVAVEDYPELFEFVDDGRQFVNHRGTEIADAPLQIYYSALIFSPTSSVLRRQYLKEIPRWIHITSTTYDSWGQSERTFRCTDPHCASFSPDSTSIAVGTIYGSIWIWNLITGELEQTLWDNGTRYENGVVLGLLFSASGRDLTAVYENGTIITFNVLTGKREQRKKLPFEVKENTAIRLLPDSRIIAFTSEHTKAVCHWNFDIGETKIIHGQFEEWIMSPNAELIASYSDGRVKLSKVIPRDAEFCAIEEISAWEVKDSPRFHVVFSSDLKRIAFRTGYDTSQIWDIEGQPELVMELRTVYVEDIVFTPDGNQMAVSAAAGTIEIWDLATRHVTHRLEGHARSMALTFAPNGRKLVSSAFFEEAVRIWDLHGLSEVDQAPGSPTDAYKDLYSPTNSSSEQAAIYCGYQNISRIRELATGKLQHRRTKRINKFSVFSPDNNYVALFDIDGCFKVLSTITRKPNLVLENPFGVTAAFSPDSRRVAIHGNDGHLWIYDSATGREERSSPKGLPGSELMAFSPSGDMVASSLGPVITLWTLGKEPIQDDIDIGYGHINVLAFSDSGKQLATGCKEGLVNILDLTTGKVHTKSLSCATTVYSLAFAPDDTRIASRCMKTVQIWDMNKEDPIKILPCHPNISTRTRLLLNWEILAMYTVDEWEKWVIYNGQRLLAIPADFRPKSVELLSATSLVLLGVDSPLGILHLSPDPSLEEI
ncbi:hypothetical protein AnigIFM56816_006703 [Aspergillus niger]|nr:hypothetical protein AnigIFM56816_006703 [Aspergillus niger]